VNKPKVETQTRLSAQNKIAWESNSYKAWVSAYGTPELAAAKLVENPEYKVRKVLPFVDKLKDKEIAVPLGSHARFATCLALLGANVTVFDISESNRKYALELAKCAKVKLRYELGDFLQTSQQFDNHFDSVIMELGVLHYFSDLEQFFQALAKIVKTSGSVVLNEFHPIMGKALKVTDGGISLKGDYFEKEVKSSATPFSTFLEDETVPSCLIRQWNIGEVVTAFASCGFRVKKLIEESAADVKQLPGTYIVQAEKISAQHCDF